MQEGNCCHQTYQHNGHCYVNMTARAFPFPGESYTTIKRTELCECSLSAGPHYLVQTMVTCSDTGPESDGIFQTGFHLKIVFDYLRTFLNIPG